MSFKDITQEQNKGFTSVSSKGISDNSTLGIIKNTITGIPKATLKVGGDILHGIMRSFASAGLTLTGQEEIKPQTEFEKKAFSFLYGGTEPVKNIQNRVVENENKIKESTFAQKYGIDKYATPLAFAGVMGSTSLDLTMFGGVEKNAIKALVKETSESGVIKILKGMKISDDVIKEFAPKLAETTSEVEIKDALKLMKNSETIKALSTSEKSLSQTEAPLSTLTKEVPGTISKTSQIKQPILNQESQLSSIEKITQALKEVKPLRGQQEKLYTQERGVKLAQLEKLRATSSGEKTYIAQLEQLKGGLSKIDYTPLKEKLTQSDIDNLFTHIDTSPVLSTWDTVTAKNGLVKILGGKLPTEGEIAYLSKVFPKDFIEQVMSKRSLWQKIGEGVLNVANIPRAVMSSFDLSAPFRQGLFLINKPKRFFGAFGEMFKSFGSEKAFKALQESIMRKPTFKRMQESKLALTDMNALLNKREEQFMSNWAEKIPLLGAGIRASGRAYTGFLNKVRADVFEDLVLKADNLGLTKSNPALEREIAKFVNTATGRGSLEKTAFGNLERSAVALNSFFFSPRLMASRLTLLNPAYYIKASPFVRKEALKSLFTLAGVATTVLTLSKMGGAEVGNDLTSSDFGKIKINDTRVDILGGFQQYIVAATRLITGKYTSTVSGETSKLGEGYKALSRYDILLRQVESKEAPIIGFITALAKGKDASGKPISIPQKTLDIFTPMTIGALVDIAKEDPQLIPLSALGSFGLGVQTYQSTGKGFGAVGSSATSTGFGSVTESLNQGFGQ